MEGRDDISATPRAASRDDAQAPWLERLGAATSEADVLAACGAYLASLGTALAALPPECLPRSLASPGELSTYALDLVRRSLAAAPCGELEQRVARFFAFANARMAQVLRDRQRRPELVRLFTATSLQLAREIDAKRPPLPED